MGPYAELDYDHYFGGISDPDLFVVDIEPDASDMLRLLVGAKLREDALWGSRFYAEQHAGIGAIFYSAIRGTETATGETREFLAASTRVAGSFGAGLGYEIGRDSEVFLGMTCELNQGAKLGDDFMLFVPERRGTPHLMYSYGASVGLSLRF